MSSPTTPTPTTPAHLRDGRMVMLAQSHPDLDTGFTELYPKIAEYSMTSVERMYALYGAVRYVHASAIDGDIVECGVWRGGSSMLAALTLAQVGAPHRRIHMFDTFSGMTTPTPRDQDLHGTQVNHRWDEIRTDPHNPILCMASLDEVRANLATTGYPSEHLTYVQGNVEDTLPGSAPDRIALLRLDTDWYESTYHELQHLYPRLAAGGILLIDDYGHWQGAQQAVDDYFGAVSKPPFLIRLDYTGRIAVKPE